MASGKLNIASATPAITSGSAYANGNALGGILTFPALADGGFCSIYSMTIADATGQNALIDLFLFNKKPTSTITDKTAATINYADLQNCIGVVSTVATDYAVAGTASVAGKSGKLNLFLGVAGAVDNNVYGIMIMRGAATYTSTSAITVNIVAEVPRWDS
jgi:hypothetical protein